MIAVTFAEKQTNSHAKQLWCDDDDSDPQLEIITTLMAGGDE